MGINLVVSEIISSKTCSYWWSDISVICCHFCISHICVDSHHLGLFCYNWCLLDVMRTRVKSKDNMIGYITIISVSALCSRCYILTSSSLSQTSFSLYLHNQWTDFHKLSCAGKPQMRAIRIYVGYTKATTNDWDIRPSVAIKALSANISWTAERIRTVELALESAHQSVSNDIWCVSKQ